MALSLWNVQGKFVIPGTRKHGSVGPIRVIAGSRQQASEELAPFLNDKFRKEIPENHAGFGKHWAMMNLQWEPFTPKKVEA